MASMAALAVLAERSEGRPGSASPNPLRDQADACLEGLEETARLEAMLAARKVRFTAGFANTTRAMSPPDEQPHQRLAREMGVVAEVACALTVSERTATALLAESHRTHHRPAADPGRVGAGDGVVAARPGHGRRDSQP